MTLFDITITSFRQSYLALAVAGFSVAGKYLGNRDAPYSTIAVVAVSTKWSLRAVNAFTFVKVLSNVL